MKYSDMNYILTNCHKIYCILDDSQMPDRDALDIEDCLNNIYSMINRHLFEGKE